MRSDRMTRPLNTWDWLTVTYHCWGIIVAMHLPSSSLSRAYENKNKVCSGTFQASELAQVQNPCEVLFESSRCSTLYTCSSSFLCYPFTCLYMTWSVVQIFRISSLLGQLFLPFIQEEIGLIIVCCMTFRLGVVYLKFKWHVQTSQ